MKLDDILHFQENIRFIGIGYYDRKGIFFSRVDDSNPQHETQMCVVFEEVNGNERYLISTPSSENNVVYTTPPRIRVCSRDVSRKTFELGVHIDLCLKSLPTNRSKSIMPDNLDYERILEELHSDYKFCFVRRGSVLLPDFYHKYQ